MISDLIVWGSVAFSVAFLIAWAWSPPLRAWIERPKHQFLDAVRGYDRASRSERTGKEPTRP